MFAVLCLAVAIPASASTVYDNGGINGTESAWTINFGYAVSDSFTLSSSTTLTGAQIGLWAFPGDRPTTVDWSIGTYADDSSLGSGTAGLTNTFQYTNGYGYDILESTFSLSGTLGAGTYWFTLQNAVVPNGDPIYWDINQGPSSAWESSYGYLDNNGQDCANAIGYSGTCSDSFQIYGNPSTTPEPASLLLMGSGLLMFGGYVRRKIAR